MYITSQKCGHTCSYVISITDYFQMMIKNELDDEKWNYVVAKKKSFKQIKTILYFKFLHNIPDLVHSSHLLDQLYEAPKSAEPLTESPKCKINTTLYFFRRNHFI